MRLTIDAVGEEIVSRDLLRFGERAVDVEPAMHEVADLLRRSMVRQFDSAGAYGSGGWAPLAASTVAAKQAQGLDPRILRARGDLFDSLTEEGHPDHLSIVRHDGLDFGTTDPKARFHQTGTARMPQRRPVQLPEADRREAVRILQRHIVGSRGLLGGLL